MRRLIAVAVGSAVLLVTAYVWESGKRGKAPMLEVATSPISPTKEQSAGVTVSPEIQHPQPVAQEGEKNSHALSEDEKAYNRKLASEKRDEIMHGRLAYLQAKRTWMRELNAAMEAAGKSGDYSEVERIQMEKPDKKAYIPEE